MIYIYSIAILALAIVARLIIGGLFASKEPTGKHSDKAIIGNGWGIYGGEYVEGRYDI